MNPLNWLVQRLPGSVQVRDGMAFALGKIAAANLPTCNATRQFEERVIPGAAGVADRSVVCVKDAADAFAWTDSASASYDDRYVNVTGDTMTGSLNLGANLLDFSNVTGEKISLFGTASYGIGVEGNELRLASGGTFATIYTGGYAGTERARISSTGVTLASLVGTGTRAVQASAAGLLSAFSGTGIVSAASGVLSASTAPTVTDFTNATHNHLNAAGGGNIASTSVTGLGWVWLASSAPSGVGSASFDSVFTSTYKRYKILFELALASSNTALNLNLRVGGVTSTTALYSYSSWLVTGAGASAASGASTQTLWLMMGAGGAGVTTTDICGEIMVSNPQATDETQITFSITARYSTPAYQSNTGGGTYNATTSYDGFVLSPGTGNLTGSVSVYGLRDS